MPVDERIVETDFDTFGAECLDRLANQVLLVGRVADAIVGVFGGPQTKAVVVLGGDDEIFHARQFGHTGPFFGVEQIGVEVGEVLLVVGNADFFAVADPFVAGGQGVQPPVDEHAEAVVGKPRSVGFAETGRHWRFLCRLSKYWDIASIRHILYVLAQNSAYVFLMKLKNRISISNSHN